MDPVKTCLPRLFISSGYKINSPTMITKSKRIINAGNILIILLNYNLIKENFCWSISCIIVFVIKKPEITKKISTPTNPPDKISGKLWKKITPTTAIALNPSIDGT